MPVIVAVFSAAPDPAAPDAEAETLDGVPLSAPVLDEHAAAPNWTVAAPAAATILIRIDLFFTPFSVPTVK